MPAPKPIAPAGPARASGKAGLRAVFFALCLGLAMPARACPVCAPTAPLTAAQRMIDADAAVLARPPAPGSDRWRVVAVVQGAPDGLSSRELEPPAFDPPDARPLLLVRDRRSRTWSAVGPIAASETDRVRQWAGLRRSQEMQPADWRERIAAFVPLLEHPEPLVAQTAYGEIARAPYGAMRAARPLLDARRLAGWLDDPALAPRQPLYLLLLGIAGGPADAARIARDLAAIRPDSPPAATITLPALLAADLELRGPARLAAIEKAWLLDRIRPIHQVQAALVALSVHGTEDATVPRRDIAQAYHRLIAARPAAAGLVAQDLAAWQDWSATPAYVALLESPRVPMSSRVAIVQYLRASPTPEARAAIERADRLR
jgi:hypothetical protein